MAAGDLPFVVRFDDHGGGQAQERRGGGGDLHDISAAFDLLVETVNYPAFVGGATVEQVGRQRLRRWRWSARACATRSWRAASSFQPRFSASVFRVWMSASWSLRASRNSGAVM